MRDQIAEAAPFSICSFLQGLVELPAAGEGDADRFAVQQICSWLLQGSRACWRPVKGRHQFIASGLVTGRGVSAPPAHHRQYAASSLLGAAVDTSSAANLQRLI